ncbi:MAG: 16S rRNA (adenine(1518)-N(6)/adenine(1519)-N(6))-dimethyltransferase RsmA [Candidatus Cloacimonadaceae bacterium]
MSIRPLKQFGQHFLIDDEIADSIVDAAEIKFGEPVWEIGPGQGVLTGRLLKKTEKLTAFEIDYRLAALLDKKFGSELKLINKDILAINWKNLLSEEIQAGAKQVKLVSNLPYQITSPVLYAIEENEQFFSRIVIMIQKEVAERLSAKAGCKAYGVMTLKLRYAFDVELLFKVPPTAFAPPPKVESAVVLLKPRQDKPQLKSLDTYRLIINKAFAQRRKTLRNNLRTIFAPEELIRLEQRSGIDFQRRGETIEEGEFVHLADCACDLAGH